jgi:hypothetical protein
MTFRVGGTERMSLDWTGLTVNGAFVSSSDRNVKQDVAPVDPKEVLAKVAALPVHTWSYTNSPSIRHVGPMAQDFHAAFGVGPDNRHIATVDADGVALAAIQGLNTLVQEKDARIAQLEADVAELRSMVRALSRRSAEESDRPASP